MSTETPKLFAGLCDDAAVFPPGDLPLAEALPAHHRHRAAGYGGIVGSFVLGAKDLDRLAALDPASLPGLDLSLTVPSPGEAAAALAAAETVAGVTVVGLEVAVPDGVSEDRVVATLHGALQGRDLATYVELPRDERRAPLVRALAGTPYLAKLRTGGVRADLHPDEKELAAAVHALVSAGVPFKATAGLHHAVRNTDPVTGFEQHGFLNLLLATAAASSGADEAELVQLLEQRSAEHLSWAAERVDPSVRRWFRSFGTCSIVEPVGELVRLGLLPADHAPEETA